VRPRSIQKLCDRADRHHLTGVVARLQPGDIRYFLAESAIGLCRDTEGAAEEIELIDEDRAEIDLQGLEYPVDGNAQHLRAHAIDICRDAWRTGVEQRKHAAQLGYAVTSLHQFLRHRLQCLHAAIT